MQYYNDSTGEHADGEAGTTGPWNSGDGTTVVEAPALAEFQVLKAMPKAGRTALDNDGKKQSHSSSPARQPKLA